MIPVSRRKTFAFAVFVPCAVVLWMMGLPGSTAIFTYVMAATLLVTMGGIIATTWKNTQEVDSLAQPRPQTQVPSQRHR